MSQIPPRCPEIMSQPWSRGATRTNQRSQLSIPLDIVAARTHRMGFSPPMALAWGMPDRVPAAHEREANLVAAKADLAAARAAGDEVRASLLEALIESGGMLLVYRPDRQHYSVLFGELERDTHVAVVVPGLGDETNLRSDWLPAARNLFEAARSTAVVLWKGYNNPSDTLNAVVMSIECDEGVMVAGRELAEFVQSLRLRPDQTLTLVAHSFGSVVTGAALADYDLTCTDVVVAGSPGMTVEGLRQLHVKTSHFFSEEAPGDTVAQLGIFGASPTSPGFGGTRMRTQRARPRKSHGPQQVLRAWIGGPREHRRCRDRALLACRGATPFRG